MNILLQSLDMKWLVIGGWIGVWITSLCVCVCVFQGRTWLSGRQQRRWSGALRPPCLQKLRPSSSEFHYNNRVCICVCMCYTVLQVTSTCTYYPLVSSIQAGTQEACIRSSAVLGYLAWHYGTNDISDLMFVTVSAAILLTCSGTVLSVGQLCNMRSQTALEGSPEISTGNLPIICCD